MTPLRAEICLRPHNLSLFFLDSNFLSNWLYSKVRQADIDMSFSSIPILDLSLAEDSVTKPAFLNDLRNALLEVGFLYIKNFGIDDELIQQVIEECIAFFDLPMEEKLKIEMKNGKL